MSEWVANNTTTLTGNDSCSHHPVDYLQARFYLVGVVGSLVAAIGIVCNSVLCHLFMQRMKVMDNSLLYLTALAVLDLFVEISYILALPIGFLAERYEIVWLHEIWHMYIPFVFPFGQVSITCTGFIIMAASIEQLLQYKQKYKRRWRYNAIALAVIGGLLLKGSIYFEIAITWNELCSGLARVSFGESQIVHNDIYRTVWMFWIRNICHVLVPFFFLIFIHVTLLCRAANVVKKGVVRGLVTMVQKARHFKRRSGKKSAMRMLVAVVVSYLTMHLLNVCLTIYEFVDETGLMRYHQQFYSFASDTQSLLTILCGTIRLAIYYACNQHIRRELRAVLVNFGNWLCCCRVPVIDTPDVEDTPYLTALAFSRFARKRTTHVMDTLNKFAEITHERNEAEMAVRRWGMSDYSSSEPDSRENSPPAEHKRSQGLNGKAHAHKRPSPRMQQLRLLFLTPARPQAKGLAPDDIGQGLGDCGMVQIDKQFGMSTASASMIETQCNLNGTTTTVQCNHADEITLL